ncbi:MAG: adenosine kinase [Caulobacteraceae bacterium]|nr:adenosine kinase [Caulobacteraceae bacterium]
MPALYDVAAIGNAIVDVIAPADDAFLQGQSLLKGGMELIDEARAAQIYSDMAAGIETSGGSAANTISGVASFGGRGAFCGKVARDQLGEVFVHDIEAQGIRFGSEPLEGGPATGRCLIAVTPDGQRTMATYLGSAALFSPGDVDADLIAAAEIVYLEGYLFDPLPARQAFAKAAAIARTNERLIALTLSDAFVVDRHRHALLGFIESEVDVLFANEAEIMSLFEADSFEVAAEAARALIKISAITRSEKGSVVISGPSTHAVAAVPIEKVVDTTGAGDQYAAGFCFGLATGRSLEVCGRLGSLAAAEVIAHYGPRPQVSLRELAATAGL